MINLMPVAVVALAAVFSLPLPAPAGTGDTNWMSKGKFGIFMHYQ